MHYEKLTESQIEARVENAIDALDKRLLSNQITHEQYDKDIVRIDKWASQQYEHLKNAKSPLFVCVW